MCKYENEERLRITFDLSLLIFTFSNFPIFTLHYAHFLSCLKLERIFLIC